MGHACMFVKIKQTKVINILSKYVGESSTYDKLIRKTVKLQVMVNSKSFVGKVLL